MGKLKTHRVNNQLSQKLQEIRYRKMHLYRKMNLLQTDKPTKETAKGAKRRTQREIRASQRGLDREIHQLDRQEKQMIMELKQRAKKVSGTDPSLKVMAKQLVQLRQQRSKLNSTKSQIGAMGMHATTISSQVAAANAFGSVSNALKQTNAQMNTTEMMKIITEFTKENERLQMNEDMIDDVLTEAFDEDGIDEEVDQVTNQVLAELGVEMDSKFVGLNAPITKPQSGEALSSEEKDVMEGILPDLKSRLDAL